MADETMRAGCVPHLGGPRSVRVEQAPVPALRPGTVQVRVRAAGINFADVAQTRGMYVGGPRPPYVAGVEAAGEIVALGEGGDFQGDLL